MTQPAETVALTPGQLVEAYVKLRDHKKQAEEAFKKSLERTIQAMDKIEAMLLDALNVAGADSLACPGGTAYKNTQTSATVKNRDAFLKHVIEHEAWDGLDVKANKTYVKEYIAETGETVPGVEVTEILTVGVRRKS